MKSKIQSFPYVFGRKGAASFNLLKPLQKACLLSTLADLEEKQLLLKKMQSVIVPILYQEIKTSEVLQLQNTLLNIKRNVFNGRSVSLGTKSLKELKNTSILSLLREYERIRAEEAELKTKFRESFDKVLIESTQYILELSKCKFLKNGLLFSSNTLSGQLDDRTGQKDFGKKTLHTSLSLLKYITRSVAKTSPFSSFNPIFALKQNYNSFDPINIGGRRSKISLNSLVLLLLKKTLISSSSVRNYLSLVLNPTILKEGNSLNFCLTACGNERVCTMQNTELIDFILNIFNNRECVAYAEFVLEIVKVTGESAEKVGEYCEKLLKEGIIIFQFPISIKKRNWLGDCISFLDALIVESSELKLLVQWREVLLYLNDQVKVLEKTHDMSARHIIVQESYQYFNDNVIDEIDLVSNSELHSLKSEILESNLFYEDVLTDEVKSERKDAYIDSIEKIEILNRYLLITNYKHRVREKFAEAIRTSYGGNKVPLLEFYRNVYLQDLNFNHFDKEYQLNFLKIFDRFFKALPQLIDSQNVFLDSFLSEEEHKASVGFDLFFQVADFNGQKTMVINNIFQCPNTNLSRYYNLYDFNAICADIKEYLSRFYSKSRVVELTDDSIHNLNSYPKILDAVLDVSIDSKASHSLSVCDLFICLKEENVIITDRSDNQVIPFDFSLESIRRRSSLMQFIDHFNDTNTEGIAGLLTMYEEIVSIHQAEKPIIVIPRLYLSKKILLSRKKWIINDVETTGLFKQETTAKQFATFAKFQKEHHIPDHVFVKVVGQKPQYINLSAPIMFVLLKKLVGHRKGAIEISEMKPSPQDLLEDDNGEPFVIENIYSVYSNE